MESKKIKYFHSKLRLNDIDDALIRDYRLHLIKQGDKPNTVAKALSVFRVFIRKMLADKLIDVDPFEKIKIGRVYSNRGFLTTNELKRLYLNFFDHMNLLSTPEQNVMRVFLFSCFTGLRYSDLHSLDASEIFDWKIRKQTHKTGELVYIPIPIQARLLLPENIKNGRIFNVVDNSHFNKTLRKAALKLGCHKLSTAI